MRANSYWSRVIVIELGHDHTRRALKEQLDDAPAYYVLHHCTIAFSGYLGIEDSIGAMPYAMIHSLHCYAYTIFRLKCFGYHQRIHRLFHYFTVHTSSLLMHCIIVTHRQC